MKSYYLIPKNRLKKLKYMKEYLLRDKVKLNKKEYMKGYMIEYNKRPEVKERKRILDRERYLRNKILRSKV